MIGPNNEGSISIVGPPVLTSPTLVTMAQKMQSELNSGHLSVIHVAKHIHTLYIGWGVDYEVRNWGVKMLEHRNGGYGRSHPKVGEPTCQPGG